MQTSWDQDADIINKNATFTGTLTLAGKLLTPPAAAGTLATLAGTETLSAKTLTAPVINAPVLNQTPGASTAAAGTTTADAGALPAGTASVYPTTAADGTKGVVVNVADKVTGRTLFIGNGVANQVLKVYPAAGGTINGGSADAAFSSASGKGVVLICLSSAGNTWFGF